MNRGAATQATFAEEAEYQILFQRGTIPDIQALIARTVSESASSDHLQRRVFDSSILKPRSSIVETPTNLERGQERGRSRKGSNLLLTVGALL